MVRPRGPDFHLLRVEPVLVKSLNSHAFPVNSILTNPTIDPTAVVPNLETFSLDGLDQMEVLEPVYFA